MGKNIKKVDHDMWSWGLSMNHNITLSKSHLQKVHSNENVSQSKSLIKKTTKSTDTLRANEANKHTYITM